MYPYLKHSKTLSFALLVAGSVISLQPQLALAQAPEASGNNLLDASQLGFSELQSKANKFVEAGQLLQAMPLLKELINRVEDSEEASEVKLDFPIFLIGTAYIQSYINTGLKTELTESLVWYDKLRAEYPKSQKNKDADLKRIDLLRVLGQFDKATELMIQMLSGDYTFYMPAEERLKILKDLCQTYYATNKLKEGLPYFGLLLNEAKDPEDKALAAAASFEALIAEEQIDNALRLIPNLAVESEVRYGPRLNIALLRTSDKLAELGRLSDTAIILSLIKTTDVMIRYNEDQLADKMADLERRKAYGNSQDRLDQIGQKIGTLEANLEQLKKLPPLRNELLVRRARNYTLTGRRYEAFWMFYDLAKENPNDARIEFYTYATFSNARQIGKRDVMRQVGRAYRSQFPDGEYFSDVSAALAIELKDIGEVDSFLEIVTDFLSSRPTDPASSNLLAQWGSYLFGEEQYDQVLAQCEQWLSIHDKPIFKDGLYYWKALSLLQKSEYADAITSFEALIKEYPRSLYAEDALLRKGTSQFYSQKYNEAQSSLLEYTEKYSFGNAIDQAYYFLGEIEIIAGNAQKALSYFEQAETATDSQSIYDSVVFSRGGIYEQLQEYDTMVSTFETYIKRFGGAGRLTDATLQLGRAYQFTQQPTRMLELYSDTIRQYIGDPENVGVDALIEAYAEAYTDNKTQLQATVEFLNQLRDDREFRKKIVTDRGFLFEFFYTRPDVEQSLYNKLRNHPNFNESLLNDLSPIANLTDPYRKELNNYPSETPEDLFRDLLAQNTANGNRIAETRALMGLYRIGIELDPQQRFDEALLQTATPRVVLFIADYERQKRRDFAVKAWEHILAEYPRNDAAIVSYMRLADVSAEENRRADALEYLEAIETQFPGSPQLASVILRQGELLSEMGQGDAARAKYQYILRVPAWRGIIHAQALLQIGDSYRAESNNAAAHGFYERTFLGYSHFAEISARAYLADAEALLAMGNTLDATTTLQEAVKLLEASAPEELMLSIKLKLKEIQG